MISTNVIGLTGPSGSGKSTVCEVFAQKGFHIINADQISRDVVDGSTNCLSELAEYFSSAILNADGTLNRRALAGIVFGDAQKLTRLGEIIYPYISYRLISILQDLSDKGVTMVLLDAPTLFESRIDDFCKLVVCVDATKEVRTQRIMERDNLTQAQALERIEAQPDIEYYCTRSDMIIENNGSIALLQGMAKEAATKIWEFYHDKKTAQ